MLGKRAKLCAAIPHAAVNDDVYDGYYIPQGTSHFVRSGVALTDSVQGRRS